MNEKFIIGSFVKVHKDIGVVISLETENNVPEEHLGIWYGETDENNTPLIHTVPEEYCEKITNTKTYH